MKVAAAPISWGVCEVPGWGFNLPVERVLAEMAQCGVTATEFGPEGFLPGEADERAELLRRYGLTAVGGFVPVVLHEPGHDPIADVGRALDGFGDAPMLVLAGATGRDGYDDRPELDSLGWRVLLGNLDRLAAYAARRGVTATLHPHVGTMVQTAAEVQRVLDGSDIGLCLDTGHLLIGGTDPALLAKALPRRIAHVHLKDVDAGWAQRVRNGEAGYTDAVRAGMYRPLGQGDVDIAGIVGALTGAGYTGWYVMEQDTALVEAPPVGLGPIRDVRAGLDYLEQACSK
jgi:inosose dehydratase